MHILKSGCIIKDLFNTHKNLLKYIYLKHLGIDVFIDMLF